MKVDLHDSVGVDGTDSVGVLVIVGVDHGGSLGVGDGNHRAVVVLTCYGNVGVGRPAQLYLSISLPPTQCLRMCSLWCCLWWRCSRSQ